MRFPWQSKPESAEQRVADLRAELADASAQLASARHAIGAAVADGDEPTASGLRATIERFARRERELEAAIPVAEARLAAVQAREAERRRVEELRRQNELRVQRIGAAEALDEAMRSLCVAFAAYKRAAGGISGDVRFRLGQRERFALQAALYNAAPDLAATLGVPRVSALHWRRIAQSEAGILPTHEVPTTELENDHERAAL